MMRRRRYWAWAVFAACTLIIGLLAAACAEPDAASSTVAACAQDTECPLYLRCAAGACRQRCDFGSSCTHYGEACSDGVCLPNTQTSPTYTSPSYPTGTTTGCPTAPPTPVRGDLPAPATSSTAGMAFLDDQYLYFYSSVTDNVGSTTSGLYAAALDGTGSPTKIVDIGAGVNPSANTIVASGGYVWFVDGDSLKRFPAGGGALATIGSGFGGIIVVTPTHLFVEEQAGLRRVESASGIPDPTLVIETGGAFASGSFLAKSESKIFFVSQAGSTPSIFAAGIASGAASDTGVAYPSNAGVAVGAHGGTLYFQVSVNNGTNLVQLDTSVPGSTLTLARANVSFAGGIFDVDAAGYAYFAGSDAQCNLVRRFLLPSGKDQTIGVLPDPYGGGGGSFTELLGSSAVYAVESNSFDPTRMRRMYRYAKP